MTKSTPDIADEFPDEVEVLTLPWRSFGLRKAFSGEVVTIKCYEDNSLVKRCVGEPGHGRVIVVDGGGSVRRALLGDMLAEQAASNGWSGLVIHGVIRDVEIIETIDLGVVALGSVPLKTDKRDEGQRDVRIEIGGARISPGDFIYADANGVLVSNKKLLA